MFDRWSALVAQARLGTLKKDPPPLTEERKEQGRQLLDKMIADAERELEEFPSEAEELELKIDELKKRKKRLLGDGTKK